MPTNSLKKVSATQLVRDLAAIRSEVARDPIAITSHGRTDLVLLSAERYSQLSQGLDAFDRAVAQAKLDIVLDCVSTHVVIVGHDFRVKHINRAMLRSHKLAGEGWRGTEVRELLPPALAPFLIKRFEGVLASGVMAEFDFPSELRPGRHIHARLVPWPGGIAYFSDDVTDGMTALDREMELAALREAVSAAGTRGIGSVTADGIVVSADAGLAALTGADEQQLVNSRFLTLFDPADRSEIEGAIGRREPARLSVNCLHAGTSVQQVTLSLAPFVRSDGRHLHAFVLESR